MCQAEKVLKNFNKKFIFLQEILKFLYKTDRF